MFRFFDLHNHSLCGVDDGASNFEEMVAMLEASYADGVRAICFTPHFSPYHYGDTSKVSAEAFERISEYASEKHSDMQLFLGHELGYYPGCLESLQNGRCRTLAGSRYVLVDFPQSVEFSELQRGLDSLMRGGFLPILAHAERYTALYKQIPWLWDFVASGGLIQLNASSCQASFGSPIRRQWLRLVREGLVHVIASDAHKLKTRSPQMSVCVSQLQKVFSDEELQRLVWDNAWKIVHNELL